MNRRIGSKGPGECLGIWSAWWLDPLLRCRRRIAHSLYHSKDSVLKIGLMAVEHPKHGRAPHIQNQNLFGQTERHSIGILGAINQHQSTSKHGLG